MSFMKLDNFLTLHLFYRSCLVLHTDQCTSKRIDHKYADHEGRQLIAVLGNDERKFIVVNVYFPNDHKQGVTFAEQMYTKVLEVQAKYLEHITFCAGDMNVCLSSNDSLISE